jgi:hypothetical protein
MYAPKNQRLQWMIHVTGLSAGIKMMEFRPNYQNMSHSKTL